ncbi:hypothetical protein BCR35DRAFT_316054 [Leucosporidium creatinivorum]|uniref:Xylanolytic transcriptional activator regulatory domain-containing protein n=1 Tax=Leucosporidium creatinivorum TaxID=106004 RepID=A0A1Y2D6R6_9BASI|nr:hypothetical protein BCR35DRAFT_316054 [Leucosporidium creatinivorum]
MHPSRAGEASGSPSSPPTYSQPFVLGLRAVEEDLESLYESRTGAAISLRLPDLDTHPSLRTDSPLPPLPSLSWSDTLSLLDIFAHEVHIIFGFISQDRLAHLAKRHQELPGSLSDDQLALLFAVFAMASYRQEIFSRNAHSPPSVDPQAPPRADVAFYRHAVEKLGSATTVTALHALIALQLYAMSACSVAATRSIIGKMAYLVQELGLHRKSTASAYPPETGASGLLFYAVFVDTYYASLVGQRPFLPTYDEELIASQRDDGIASPIIAHLITIQHSYLTECLGGKEDGRSAIFVLGTEGKLWRFSKDYEALLGDNSSMLTSLATTQ